METVYEAMVAVLSHGECHDNSPPEEDRDDTWWGPYPVGRNPTPTMRRNMEREISEAARLLSYEEAQLMEALAQHSEVTAEYEARLRALEAEFELPLHRVKRQLASQTSRVRAKKLQLQQARTHLTKALTPDRRRRTR